MTITVQAKGFSQSVITGTDIKGAILWSYKHVGNDKWEPLPDHRTEFESREAAWAYCLKQGYSVPYKEKS